MGIDRIGKGGAPPAAPETQGSGSVEKKGSIEKAFSVERPDATKQAWQAGAAEAAQGSQALARLARRARGHQEGAPRSDVDRSGPRGPRAYGDRPDAEDPRRLSS